MRDVLLHTRMRCLNTARLLRNFVRECGGVISSDIRHIPESRTITQDALLYGRVWHLNTARMLWNFVRRCGDVILLQCKIHIRKYSDDVLLYTRMWWCHTLSHHIRTRK